MTLALKVAKQSFARHSGSMTFLTFSVTLNTPKNCFHKTFCLVLMHHQRKFGSKRIISSKDIIQSCLDSMNHSALTLKIVTQFLCMTPQLMMYHHTKLGYKRFTIYNFECLLWVSLFINFEHLL